MNNSRNLRLVVARLVLREEQVVAHAQLGAVLPREGPAHRTKVNDSIFRRPLRLAVKEISHGSDRIELELLVRVELELHLIQDPLAVHDDRLPGCIRIEHIRAQVGAVGPHDCPDLWIDADQPEIVGVLERSEHSIEPLNDPI